MLSDSPVELILKSQGWPEEGLPVDKASPKRPDDVRDALFRGIRQVGRHSKLLVEVKLLHLELIIQDVLGGYGYWKPTLHLKQVLQSCRHSVYDSPCLEIVFYKHGEDSKLGEGPQVVIKLSIIPKELLPSIESLPEDEQKRLSLAKTTASNLSRRS